MKLDEWKDKFTEIMQGVDDQMVEINDHLEEMSKIEDDYDEEELAAVIILKFKRMEKRIEEIFDAD